MKPRRLDLITAAVDLTAALVEPVFGAWLLAQFSEPRGVNAIWPALGLLGFCVAIVLVRRLQPEGEPNPLAPDPSIRDPTAWLGISTIVGTVLLLVAMANVSGDGLGEAFGAGGGVLGFVLAWVVVALLFTPLALLWVGDATPIRESRRPHAEVAALVASDLTMLIMVAYWEHLMISIPGFTEQGPLPAVALTGLPIMIVAFLLMCGAPRLLLLTRRFSWIGAVSLVASTGWYLVSSFYGWL